MFTKLKPPKVTEDEEPNVTISEELLRRLVDNVDRILSNMSIQERRSLASFYIGALIGTLIGVLGNFFVSFWFQKLTKWNFLGLIVSGVLLLLVSVALFFKAKKCRA